MRSKFLAAVLGLIMVVAVTVAATPTPAPADAQAFDAADEPVMEEASQAFVMNKPDGLSCVASVAGFLATGPATLVITPSGNVAFICQADVIAGPPLPNNTIRVTGVGGPAGSTCNVVINPAGKLNASCHN